MDRELTSQLYGGDARTRIRQELVLGVGGFRALKAMGITPSVVHMNEGHSGFAVIEAIRNRMEDEGVGFEQAVPRVSRQIVFTTHTPVPAGSFVQGVDVWLNNPGRPLEASGTSGMKVVLNGGLNLSVLEGWWAEAYDGLNGFAIGTGITHSNMDVHDTRDGEDLYRTLREAVIPLYYQRDRDGLPRGWIKRMKRTIRTLGWRFKADRMVMDYTLKCYVPAAGGTSSDMSPTMAG
jgi:glucan phosphorylase